MGLQRIEVVDVPVSTIGLTEIIVIQVPMSRGVVVLSVKNTGTAALDAFRVDVKATAMSDWRRIAHTNEHFTNPPLPILYARPNPRNRPVGDTSLIQIDVRGLDGIKLYASAASGGTTVSVESNWSGIDERYSE